MKKKEVVTVTIALHWIQARIINGLQKGIIDLDNDSLRQIASKCKIPNNSPQQAKHHLEQLVNLGAIQKINGQYFYKN